MEVANSEMISLEVTGSDNQTSCMTRHSASEIEGDSFIAKNAKKRVLETTRCGDQYRKTMTQSKAILGKIYVLTRLKGPIKK